jgi:hypothetical protein
MQPSVLGRLPRNHAALTLRQQLARWLAQIAAFWNRQPIDQFWPPHP